MFAPTALVVGIYREFVALGLVDTYLALIIVNAAFNLAFAIWILQRFFVDHPRGTRGGGPARRLRHGCGALMRVMLPLALPGIVTATVFTFIAAWNEYVVALTLTSSPDDRPLTVGVTTFIGQYDEQWQYLFAASLVAVVPVVILFALIER